MVFVSIWMVSGDGKGSGKPSLVPTSNLPQDGGGVGRVRWGSVGWIRLGKATKISFFLSYTSFFSFSEELYISGLGLE